MDEQKLISKFLNLLLVRNSETVLFDFLCHF